MLKDYSVAQKAIDDAVLIKPDLWAVKNLFSQTFIETILARAEHEPLWHPVQMQEYRPRVRLAFDAELNNDIGKIIQELNFSKYGLKYQGHTLWKDSAGYTIGEHSDNNRVIGAMQIYLNDAPHNLGTWFEENEIPFVKNTGYIMKNINKPLHRMKCIVPNGVTRYSLYVYLNI